MSTPNLGMPNVPTGTLEPSIPLNDALQLLDAVVQLAVEDKDLTAPPTTIEADIGNRWIVGGSATGAWASHDGEIALCTGADLWRFIAPNEGWRCDVRDEDATYRYSGSAWELFAGGASEDTLTIVTEAGAFTADSATHAGLRKYVRAGGDATFDSAESYAAGQVFNIRATGAIDLVGSGVTLTEPSGGTLALSAGMSVTVVMTSGTTADVIGQTVPA